MKLAFFFLVCFVVSLSCQQRGFRFFLAAVPSRSPYFYYNPAAAPAAVGFDDYFSIKNQYANGVYHIAQTGNSENDLIEQEEEELIDSGYSEARTPSRRVNSLMTGSPAQQRLFLPRAYLSNLFNIPIITVTSTVSTNVPSVVTVASVVSCIGSSQFRITVLAGPITTPLTDACATSRRRRDVDKALEDIMAIEPSNMEPLEVSIAPKTSRAHVVDEPEILSSQESTIEHPHPEADVSESAIHRQKRRWSSVTVTVTSTSTSFSFATTTVKKSFSLGVSGAAPAVNVAAGGGGGGGLVCLPQGYSVC